MRHKNDCWFQEMASTSQSSAVLTDWSNYNGEKLRTPINPLLVHKFFKDKKSEDKKEVC